MGVRVRVRARVRVGLRVRVSRRESMPVMSGPASPATLTPS